MKRDPFPLAVAAPLSAGSTVSGDWRAALPAVLAVLIWIIGWYWTTAAAMVQIWERSETFAHGFVVPPIAMWLIWRKRGELARMSPSPSLAWLVPLALAGFAWLSGQMAAVNSVSQLAFVALLVLTVPAILGTRVAMVNLAFPLGFLFFAVPIGEFLLPQLMQWTAEFTILALRASGIPVYREGLNFVLPTGHWSVVEACSGIRYLIASLMVGTLYAYLNYRSMLRRIIFVAVAIVIPIVANWARAYMIVMLGHLSDNRLAVGVDHLIYGWVFFGIVMLIMFWVGARWREDTSTPHDTPVRAVDVGHVAPASHFWRAAIGIALVTLIWPIGFGVIERSDAASPPKLATLPDVAGWTFAAGGLTPWEPHFVGPSTVLHGSYRKGEKVVGLYIGYYRNQTLERKLISSDNVLVRNDDRRWAKVAEDEQVIRVPEGSMNVHVENLRGSDDQRLIAARWYWIDGRQTTSDYRAKIDTVISRLRGHGDDGAVIVVYAPKVRPEEVNDWIEAFLRDAAPSINATLEHVRETR